MTNGTNAARTAAGSGMYRRGRGSTPGSTSVRPAEESHGLTVGDKVKVSLIKITERGGHEHVVCPGVVRFIGRRWICVRYDMGRASFTGGFWPEEVTPRA